MPDAEAHLVDGERLISAGHLAGRMASPGVFEKVLGYLDHGCLSLMLLVRVLLVPLSVTLLLDLGHRDDSVLAHDALVLEEVDSAGRRWV